MLTQVSPTTFRCDCLCVDITEPKNEAAWRGDLFKTEEMARVLSFSDTVQWYSQNTSLSINILKGKHQFRIRNGGYYRKNRLDANAFYTMFWS